MDLEETKSNLPLDESLGLQNRARLIQQAGIIAIFIIVILAALGLFGQGVLSNKKLEVNGNMIAYEKFGRFGGESKLVFNLSASENSIAQIAIPVAYLEHFKIETIVPAPSETSNINNEIIYNFKGATNNQITFFLIPEKRGSIEATLRGNQTNFNISHYIYP